MCEFPAANWQNPEVLPADRLALPLAGARHFTDVDGELVAVGQVDTDGETGGPEIDLNPGLFPGGSSPGLDLTVQIVGYPPLYRFCHDPQEGMTTLTSGLVRPGHSSYPSDWGIWHVWAIAMACTGAK